MEALTKKGYDVNYSWGTGVHSHNMGGAMLPEMMRWLWRDQPVSLDPKDAVERSFRSKNRSRLFQSLSLFIAALNDTAMRGVSPV